MSLAIKNVALYFVWRSHGPEDGLEGCSIVMHAKDKAKISSESNMHTVKKFTPCSLESSPVVVHTVRLWPQHIESHCYTESDHDVFVLLTNRVYTAEER